MLSTAFLEDKSAFSTAQALGRFTRGEAHHQDYFCDAAEPIWGGRGDLEIIASLGANVVRLYGNDPTLEHQKFLDHAQSLNLEVIPGMHGSDEKKMKQGVRSL